jgi:hypothetical protein
MQGFESCRSQQDSQVCNHRIDIDRRIEHSLKFGTVIDEQDGGRVAHAVVCARRFIFREKDAQRGSELFQFIGTAAGSADAAAEVAGVLFEDCRRIALRIDTY